MFIGDFIFWSFSKAIVLAVATNNHFCTASAWFVLLFFEKIILEKG